MKKSVKQHAMKDTFFEDILVFVRCIILPTWPESECKDLSQGHRSSESVDFIIKLETSKKLRLQIIVQSYLQGFQPLQLQTALSAGVCCNMGF